MAAAAKAGANLRRDRWEIVAAAAVVVGSVAILCWAGRDTWFRRDVWEFLVGREAGALDSWLRPKSGHLQILTVGLHRLLYGTAGMDFWPWYYLPHAAGYAGFFFYLWRVLLRRGADRVWAFGVYLVLLFLGSGGFISSVAVGFPLVVAGLLVAAQRLAADGEPSRADRLVVVGCFVLMVMTGSTGVAGFVACFLAAALSRVLRRWWWTFLPAAGIYAAWYAFYGGDRHGAIRWSALPDVPVALARVAGNTVGRLLGVGVLGPAVGAAALIVVAAGLGWLAWRGRLRRWDLILLGAMTGMLLMITMVRGGGGRVPLTVDRYAYVVLVLAVPLLVPHLQFGRRWPGWARYGLVVVVAGGLLAVNAWQRVEAVEKVARGSAAGRVAVEAIARAVADGEPAIDHLSLRDDLHASTAGVLTVAAVRDLLADGWVPEPARNWAGLAAARSAMRMLPVAAADDEAAPPLTAAVPVVGGCTAVEAGGALEAAVVRAGVLTLRVAGPGERTVSLEWADRFGVFPLELPVSGLRPLEVAAPPDGGAGLTVFNPGDWALEVCGLE